MTDDVRNLLDAANSALLIHERGADNHGWEVEAILAACGCSPGDPWCMALVSWLGRFAVGKDRWPIINTGSCAEAAEYCRRNGMLVTTPGPGDVAFLWSAREGRFHHAGIVTVALTSSGYRMTSGNTNDSGSVNGYETLNKVYGVAEGDRFARWQGMVHQVAA